MNLQLCAPYVPCPFNCPMCIAAKAPRFNNVYEKNKKAYFYELTKALISLNITTVVLTGDTEPTIQRDWLRNVIEFLKKEFPYIDIELQTHVYRQYLGADISCYSITTARDMVDFIHSPVRNHENSRVVFLATEEIITNLYNDKKVCKMFAARQITFKILQPTAYHSHEEDHYIEFRGVKAEDKRLKRLVRRFKFKRKSVRLDVNCQAAEGRYKIFREDGNVYSSWEAKVSERIY